MDNDFIFTQPVTTGWRHDPDNCRQVRDGVYWDGLWMYGKQDGSGLTLGEIACVVRVGKGFYVSPKEMSGPEDDVGPFNTLEEAQAAALVLYRMDQSPRKT